MMNISSGCSTSCFDFALDHLDWIDKTLDSELDDYIWKLKMGIRILKPFDLYIRKCRRWRSNQFTCLEYGKEENGDAKSDNLRLSSISFRIQDLVRGITHGLDSAFFRYIQSSASNHSDIRPELARFEENMWLFFDSDIKEFNIISLLLYHSLGDLQLVMDFIDSISENLTHLCSKNCNVDVGLKIVMQTLQKKLMHLKSFIGFATLQGVEGVQLKDLLVHVEVVAVNAASLICRLWFQRHNEQVCNEINTEISQAIRQMIVPVDPQVQETYKHVLTASKLSRSSCTFAMKENKHLVADFIDYLLHSLMEILESYTSFLVPVKEQMLKLHEGVRFLIILLSRQQKKFDELNEEIKDLIGVVVSDAGIVIFSLSVNEMKECLCKETDLALSHLLVVLKLVIAEVGHIYPLSSSSLSFPKTNELGSLDFLLKILKELAGSTADSIAFPNNQICTILEDLVFLRAFLGNIGEQCCQNGKLHTLWSRVMKVAYCVEIEIDSALLGDKYEHCLDALARDIELLKIEAEELYDSIKYGSETRRVTKTTIRMPSQIVAPIFNEALVGLNDEVESIIDRLTRGSNQFDVVAIVGMAGLGKTTLAKNIYSDPSIKFHFHICAWCTVSQVYSKHNLLLQILCVIDSRSCDQYHKMNEDDLAAKLYQQLKGKRYVIVLDDVWDIEGWNLLKHSLPDDRIGSRVLLTSRFHNLSLEIKPDSKPLHLRPLTDKESLELLQKKLFAKEDCPPTLSEGVLNVAKCCKGLPLAVVLVAGILATTQQDCWEQVTRRLTSTVLVENEHCMKTLEYSYNYLPDYLKPCLLYLGAFQEDQDIPVRKLLRLWISEGLVQKIEGKSLEDVADNYLMDLIGRSLVMPAHRRSSGGIKVCQIHDLVHQFCVTKAKEENFLRILHGDDLLTFTGPYNAHRLSIFPTTSEEPIKSRLFFPNLRCLLFFDCDYRQQLDRSSLKFLLSGLLRVLDLGTTVGPYFLREVLFLVHLRYLSIRILGTGEIPSAIANLSRLETLAVGGPFINFLLPNTIWNIQTLKHLVVFPNDSGFKFPINDLEGSPDLEHLETLSLAIDPSSERQSLQKILSKLPSIRRLKCVNGHDNWNSRYHASAGDHDGILMLNYLSRLESLKMGRFAGYEFEFPFNLRKLTLLQNRQPWSKISAIGKLPNLEVLKLCPVSFVGEKWEMQEGEFQNLRYLKLFGLDIRWWTASCDNFCCLEKLVLENCFSLEEVPSCLGETLTLDMIKVKWCHESAVNSVKQIQQEQMDMGNKDLKMVIVE
ncbi:putative late blight resistance protein homolog R1A-3 [Coffea eugenioides]|uniref:putative late blight resistance protein homolog R1A-3 n=1 Tax=Coffea eugenioides TaxID=49369 RepID=UPI000F60A4C9|nr:putative late blight resistance protein homolog R1A-3 [Coffea eugenioides]